MAHLEALVLSHLTVLKMVIKLIFHLASVKVESSLTFLYSDLGLWKLFSFSIQFWSRFIPPINGDGWIYPTLTAISLTPTLHLARFKSSSFSKPTLLLSFSTCIFNVFFCSPHFLLSFTSNSNAFLQTSPSSLLNTCPYHLTPSTFAIWTTVSFNPNILTSIPTVNGLFFFIVSI